LSQIQPLNTNVPFQTDKTSAPLVRISNLSVTFSKSQGTFTRKRKIINAVNDVSIDIFESEILSIVGESGSGKTTLARCIMALQTPTFGSVKFDGKVDVPLLRGRALLDYRRVVQMIFQDPFESLNPRLDVLAALTYPLRRLAGVDKGRVSEDASRLLNEVGLDANEVLHKFPHQLSGGERQRVNIAKALAPNPKLLVADEPITMLDASQRLNILSLLIKLKQTRKFAILLITHDLASARAMSDRTAVMYRGKLVEIGGTEELLTRPCHPYTELILKATPRIVRGHEKILQPSSVGGTEETEQVSQGCIFRPRCKYASSVCFDTEPLLEEKRTLDMAACHNPL
jgi:peptide/nickel transport system ATP-binding protein